MTPQQLDDTFRSYITDRDSFLGAIEGASQLMHQALRYVTSSPEQPTSGITKAVAAVMILANRQFGPLFGRINIILPHQDDIDWLKTVLKAYYRYTQEAYLYLPARTAVSQLSAAWDTKEGSPYDATTRLLVMDDFHDFPVARSYLLHNWLDLHDPESVGTILLSTRPAIRKVAHNEAVYDPARLKIHLFNPIEVFREKCAGPA